MNTTLILHKGNVLQRAKAMVTCEGSFLPCFADSFVGSCNFRLFSKRGDYVLLSAPCVSLSREEGNCLTYWRWEAVLPQLKRSKSRYPFSWHIFCSLSWPQLHTLKTWLACEEKREEKRREVEGRKTMSAKMKTVLEMDGGVGCTTTRVYFVPLNWTLKIVKTANLILWVLYHDLKWNKPKQQKSHSYQFWKKAFQKLQGRRCLYIIPLAKWKKKSTEKGFWKILSFIGEKKNDD